MLVHCSSKTIDETLGHLREAGKRNCECVVLWLGRRTDKTIHVEMAYLPLQVARADIFRIPPQGMTDLQALLRRTRLMVAAQVHSHPGTAFHSEADDEWAIIRHEGALSLVVPYFARKTSTANFLEQAKVFSFSPSAEWTEVSSLDVANTCLQIS